MSNLVNLTQNLENFNWNYENASTNQSQIAGRHGGTEPLGQLPHPDTHSKFDDVTNGNEIPFPGDYDPNVGGIHGGITGPTPAQPPHPDDHSIYDDGVGFGVAPNDNPQTFDVRGHTVTGDKTFDRPAESALVNMESRFGPLNTQPPDRGPYGVTDYMDGTQQGQGFIPPGGPPLGFTVDMGISEYAVGDPLNYTLTPLSHTIAAVNSNGPHGSVTEQTINLTPVAPNAWAENFMITPLANYVSQYSEPVDSLTHEVDMITLSGPTAPDDYQTELNVTPKVDDAHGSDFMTLPLEGYTSGLSPKPDSVVDTIYDRSLAYISNISEPDVPIFKQFSRGSAGLNIFDLISPNFDGFTFTEEIPYVIPQHISTGPEQFTIEPFDNTPKLEHAHSTDPLSRLLDYPGLYVNTGEMGIPEISTPDIGDFSGPAGIFDHTTLRSRLYDVYQHHFLTSPFTPISLGTDLFDETGTTQPWKGGSIHIDPDDISGGNWESTTFPDSDKRRGVFDNYILGDQFSWTHVNRQSPYGPYSDWLGSDGQVGSIHISPSGQLKAGLRYLLSEDEALIDIQSAIGGGVLPFADLDAFNPLGTPHESVYQNIDTGDYTVPTAFISQLLNSDLPSQRTFNIPAAYPDNTFAYSINNQFGTWWESLYFSEARNHPYLLSDNFEGITLASRFLSFNTANPDWPYKGVGLTFPGEGPDYFRLLPLSPEMREPAHAEGSLFGVRIWSWTEEQPDTLQPYIRKFVGQRYGSNTPRRPEIPIDHIGLMVDRVADDIKRIENWMKSDAGKRWGENQNFLQELNPRPETRAWSKHSIILSLAPFIHARRHLGETYMEAGDFGSLLPSDPVEPSWFSGTSIGSKLGAAAAALGSLNTSLGAVNFLEKLKVFGGDRNGRLVFLLDRFIIGDMSKDSRPYGINLTKLRGGVSLFGRTPKIPSHDVRSQGGPFGEDKKDSFQPWDREDWPGSGQWGEKSKYGNFVLSKIMPSAFAADQSGIVQIGPYSALHRAVHLDPHTPPTSWGDGSDPESSDPAVSKGGMGKPVPLKLGQINFIDRGKWMGNLPSDRRVSNVGGIRKQIWMGAAFGTSDFKSVGTSYSLASFMSSEGNSPIWLSAYHQNLVSGGRAKKPEYLTLPYEGLIPENAYENTQSSPVDDGKHSVRHSISPLVKHSWRFFGVHNEDYEDTYFRNMKPVSKKDVDDWVAPYVFTIGKDSHHTVFGPRVTAAYPEVGRENAEATADIVKNTLWLTGTPGKAPQSSDDINYWVNSYDSLGKVKYWVSSEGKKSSLISYTWRFMDQRHTGEAGSPNIDYFSKYGSNLDYSESIEEADNIFDNLKNRVFTIGKDSHGAIPAGVHTLFEKKTSTTASIVKNKLWMEGTPGKARLSSKDINYYVSPYSELGEYKYSGIGSSPLVQYSWRFMDAGHIGGDKGVDVGNIDFTILSKNQISTFQATFTSLQNNVFTIGKESHGSEIGSRASDFWTGILQDSENEAGTENPIIKYIKNTNWAWGSIGTAPRDQDSIKFTTLPYNKLNYDSSYATPGQTTWASYRTADGGDGKLDWSGGKFKGVSSPLVRFSWRFMDASHVDAKAPYWEAMDDEKGIFAEQVTDLKTKVFTINETQAAKNLGPSGSPPGDLIKRYQTLSYGHLNKEFGYFNRGYNLEPNQTLADLGLNDDEKIGIQPLSPGERQSLEKLSDSSKRALLNMVKPRKEGMKITDGIGNQGKGAYYQFGDDEKLTKEAGKVTDTLIKGTPGTPVGGIIKKGNLNKYKSEFTDKINMLPYGQDYTDPKDGAVDDFIKFKFYDRYNKKFIIFRALLSGISDSITPEWSGTRYIGRPDQVYVYSGTERAISFTFDVYPKTRQEFPVLLEKVNYLIGLCYPSFTPDNRMVAPFINLTIGDMFNDTPGFLNSLSMDVDDVSTWEIDEGLQFPKKITCACEFTYIGKYLPSSLGKHYELPWLRDHGWSGNYGLGGNTRGTFESVDNAAPTRITPTGGTIGDLSGMFSDLGSTNTQPTAPK
jgi:hypothetical protein